MIWAVKIAFLSLSALVTPVFSDELQTFQDSFEREFALRSVGTLSITNARGEIAIEGWSQDRVRVTVVRKVSAGSADEARKVRENADVFFRSTGKESDLSAEYGRGLTIEERLKERGHPLIEMDLAIRVPSRVPLKVFGTSRRLSVKGTNASLTVRTLKGPIQLESLKGGPVEVFCPQCEMSLHNIGAAVRCMGGSGSIQLSSVLGSSVYIESDSGNVSVDEVEGDQLYVTHSGSVSGTRMKGKIEFHSVDGNVRITDSSGFLSGMTESGKIDAQMTAWRFLDKALLESIDGSIRLTLPGRFSGDVDLRSGTGTVFSAFPLSQIGNPLEKKQEALPQRPLSRLMGIVGEGGDQLKLASEKGNVELLSSDRSDSALR